jgi:hypothetical protein
MALDTAERLYLDRQVTLARAIFVALALVDLIEMSATGSRAAASIFLAIYLLLALAVLLYERLSSETSFTIPLVADFVALAVFLFLTPTVSAWWFLFLFVVFALATQGNTRLMLALVTVATAGIIFRVAMMELSGWSGAWHWLTIGLGTVISGLGMGFLGAREREHLERQQFLEKVSRLLQFDRGLTESVRQALGEIALAFECEQACLAIRDEELERLFVWKIHPNDRELGGPETLPLSRSDTFLTDAFESSFCWEFNDSAGIGFGWDRRSGQIFRKLPAPPDSTREEFGARTLLAVTIEAGGRPTGRVLLVNPHGPDGSGALSGSNGRRARRHERVTPAIHAGRPALAGADRAACGTPAGKRLFNEALTGAGGGIGAQPDIARFARRDPADAAEPEYSAGCAAPQVPLDAGAGRQRVGNIAKNRATGKLGIA